MQVCTFEVGLTVGCVCTICIWNRCWEKGNFCEKDFRFSLCLAAHAVIKLLHEQNPGISENLYSPFDQLSAALNCKLWNFQFVVRVRDPCFDFNTVKTCDLIFCLSFFVLKVGLLLPCYRRNLCYL